MNPDRVEESRRLLEDLKTYTARATALYAQRPRVKLEGTQAEAAAMNKTMEGLKNA